MKPLSGRRWPKINPNTSRDTVLFLIGAFGFLHEVLAQTDRQYVIFGSLALCGLPLVLPRREPPEPPKPDPPAKRTPPKKAAPRRRSDDRDA